MQEPLSTDIKTLQEQLISQKQLIDKLTITIEKLQQFIDILTRKLYGKRSEKKAKPDNNENTTISKHNKCQQAPTKERNQRKFPVELAREKNSLYLAKRTVIMRLLWQRIASDRRRNK